MSDIRLNSSKNKHTTHGLEKKFFIRGYKFFHNSKTSSRGVGILIKNNIQIEEMRTAEDPGDNYLLKK
jgi:hypothetical protein